MKGYKTRVLSALTGTTIVATVAVLVFGVATTSATVPYNNELVSRDSSGNLENGDAQGYGGNQVSTSADGRYVAFVSGATNLVSGDTNGNPDLFVKDRQTGNIVRASLDSSGAQVNDPGIAGFKISANGRFAVFTGKTYYFGGGSSPLFSVYLRDLQNNTTELISKNTSGNPGNANSNAPDISADGRYVAFTSSATDLVSSDTNGYSDIFVRDRLAGITTLVSKSTTGVQGNAVVAPASISCDGAYVVFNTSATNLVPGDTNGYPDTFLVDRINGTTTDLTLSGNGSSSLSSTPQISCDGSTVVFESDASNLVSGDTNSLPDVFAYDMYSGNIERINASSSGAQATDYGVTFNGGDFSVSFTGRYIAFDTLSSQMTTGDSNAKVDVFLRDRQAGTTEIVSKRDASTQTTTPNYGPFISADGRHIAYYSTDTGLVSGDTNGKADIFMSDTGIN